MVIMNGEIGSVSNISSNEEESFVVLERSTTDNQNSLISDISWNPSMLQSTSIISPTILEPSQPKNQVFSMSTSTMNMSPEDIQKRLHDVLKENVELKETLHQNNMAMKQQFSTLQTWQEEVFKVHQNHKEKFEETKNLILKLKAENQELKKFSLTNNSFTLEKTKMEEENVRLSAQITMMQEKIDSQTQKEKRLYSQIQPSAKEVELYKVVEQLTRQLEVAERARRQQTIDIERLSVQLSRTQNVLMSTQQQLAQTQVPSQSAPRKQVDLDSRSQRYEQLLQQLADSVKKEAEKLSSMDTWIQMATPGEPLQLEITELRKLLSEEQVQSVARKENLNIALSSLQELFAEFKTVVQEMETLKEDMLIKEKHDNEYETIQKKSYSEKIDSLTAQLVGKEEALAISERNLLSLQECLRLQNETKGSAQATQEIKILQDKLEVMTKCLANKDQQLAQTIEQIQDLQKKNKCLEVENESIELLKSQEKHNNEYETIQKKSYSEKIDSLTAQLVGKEEALAISERNLLSLQECLRLQNETKGSAQATQEIKILRDKLEVMTKCLANKDQQLAQTIEQIQDLQKKNKCLEVENETIELLKSQASLYQSDFEAERHSREELVSEKNRLIDDLRHLQRRNQQLLDELRSYQEEQFNNFQRGGSHEHTPPPKPYEEEIPPPKRYYCPNPKCNMMFTTVEPLELHVGDCLNLD